MAKFNLYLKGALDTHEFRRSTKPALVFIVGNHKKTRYRISTGISVSPQGWDFKHQKCKASTANSSTLNETLQSKKELVERAFYLLLGQGVNPTPEILRDAVEQEKEVITKQFEQDQAKKHITLSNAFDLFLSENLHNFKPNTVRNYQRNRNRIAEFESLSTKPTTLENYSERDYNNLMDYLKRNHNHSKNTLADLTKTIKSVMKWANNNPELPTIEIPQLKVTWEDVENVYLTEDELDHLLSLDLSKNPRLDKVRDLFLVGCWTGLRFSDFTKLAPENIAGNVAKVKTQKTGEAVTIPLHPIVKQILAKYEGNLPGTISNQKMNDYLKELCRLAGFMDKAMESRTQGGEKVATFREKWERVSTHTARRSFATNQYKAGVKSIFLMRITGHRTEKAFLKYIKLDQEEAATQLADFWENRYQSHSNLKVV